MDTIEATDTSDLFPLLESVLGAVIADAMASRTGMAAETDTTTVVSPVAAGSTPVGLAVLDAASLNIVKANAALAGVLGRNDGGDALIGRHVGELTRGIGASEAGSAFQHAAETGAACVRVVRDDSPAGPRYLRCALVPLRRADGAFATLLLTVIAVPGERATDQGESHNAPATVEPGDVAAQAAARAEVGTLLARASTLDAALEPVAKALVGTFGDCCAIFQVNEDRLQLMALHHRDAGEETRLRAAFTDEPPPRDGELIGQVVASGNSLLASHWGPQYGEVALGLHASVEASGIESLACVPLRAEGYTHGALLLFATQMATGGSGRILGGGDLVYLQEIGDLIAHAMSFYQARAEMAAAQAERNTVLEASTDGIAVYDALGRLRQINAAGRALLSRPEDVTPEPGHVGGTVSLRRTFLTPDGLPMTSDELPWTRALRGEQIGVEKPMPIVLEWAGGVRRTLLVRAWPLLDASDAPTGAVVSMEDADRSKRVANTAQDVLLVGEGEWARWRETMELLDEAVVLCAPSGAAVFVNTAARELLGLPWEEAKTGGDQGHPLWDYVRQLDGTALPAEQTPVANAMSETLVRAQPTAVPMADGTMRPIYWDARRIDRADGSTLGVALVAWPALEEDEDIDPQDTQPVEPMGASAEQPAQPKKTPQLGVSTPPVAAEPAPSGQVSPPSAPSSVPSSAPTPDQQFAKTTLLPGRRAGRWDAVARTANDGMLTDLTEICARAARAHRGTIQRRLEIRLPRRSVLVDVDEGLLERAIGALISTAAHNMPPNIPLHIAVWVERSAIEDPSALAALIPPGVDVSEVNTFRFQNGQLPAMLPPMEAISAGATTAPKATASVAVVRVCSPNVRDATINAQEFAECREWVEQMGGNAWARLDPVLGPTYSFSLAVGESGEP